jgi:CHRD domain
VFVLWSRKRATSTQQACIQEDHMRQTFNRRSVLGYVVGSAAGAVLLSTSKPSQAAPMKFKADMNGASEVPPTTTSGKGVVTASYDPATKVLTWEGNFSGLSGPATAAHFHGPAEAGKNAAPAVWISEKGQNLASPFKGTATLTDAQADDLQKGLWYANVHTDANKGGEIRGQVVKG